jgi:hypothetical protein
MDKKSQAKIFFTALIVMGVIFTSAVTYFKNKPKSTLLADIATNILPQNQSNIGNVSMGTIVLTPLNSPSSSMPSLTAAATPTSTIIPPLTLPYSIDASTSNKTYWPKAWGDVSFTKKSMSLIPDETTHGANSFLKGSAAWTNYAIDADVSWLMGGSFNIISRSSNDTQSFVYCEFGPNGTEIMERVNGIDTQLASTMASTTDEQGATQSFGMKVYENDIACTIAKNEVVGVRVQNNKELSAGGIGFVIFGAPPAQKEVTITNMLAYKLLSDTIVQPFPVPVVPTPATPKPTPPPAPAPTSTPPNPTPSPTPAPTPTPTPAPTSTNKTLPFSVKTFNKTQGWNTWWGDFSIATHSLTMSANSESTSAGVLLDGTNAWDNYTFTAKVNWIKGETFGLYARYADAQNYVLCYFDEKNAGNLQISLKQHINGTEYILAQGTANDYNKNDDSDVTASIRVQDTSGACTFDDHTVSSDGTGNTLNSSLSGRIGFMTWDPSNGNTQVIVKSVDVANNY